jgi:hypothetical protein
MARGFIRSYLSNNEQMSIRRSYRMLICFCSPMNAMHRNGAYHCALLIGREYVSVCSTNWDLSIRQTF